MRIILSLAAIVFLYSQSIAQEIKIGVVASELVIQSYPQFKVAEEQLAREMQSWQSERKSWESDMERLQEAIISVEEKLQAGQNTFSNERKKMLINQVDSLKYDYNERLNKQASYEQERFNKRRAELLAEVFETVNEVIREIGDEEGYDLIIDSSNGTIVHAKNPDDLNDAVLNRLQNK